MCQVRILVIAMIVAIVGAYESQRASVDKMSSQRNSRDLSFGDQINYSSDFSMLRHRPFEQNSFRNEWLFGDAMTKNRELRGQRAILRDNPLEGQSTSFASEIFEGQASTYKDQAPLKKQLFVAEAPFKNLLHAQLLSNEQPSFQKQAGFIETPFASNSAKFYRDNSYDKLIDSYGRHKDMQTLPEESLYREYDNHAAKLSLVPMLSSSKQLFSLNTEILTTPSTPIYDSPMPCNSNGLSETWKMKFGSASTLGMITSASASNCNALVDSSPTMSSGAVTTIPSISVSANQSAIVGHILTSLTTKPNSPVTAIPTSIAPFDGNTPGPIHFYATKYGAVLTSLPTENELKSNMHGHLFANAPKSNFKTSEHNIKFIVPEEPKDNMRTNIRSPTLNYILSEKYKDGLKGIQNSFANYPSPTRLKHDWSLQQFSLPETSFNYAPLFLEKTKLISPSMPVAHGSTISWPTDTKSDVSALLPAKPVIPSDTATSGNPPLAGINLPLGFMTSVSNSPMMSSISGSITDGKSTSIPGSLTANIPMSIPTLSLEQTLHRAEQLRQTEEARNLWYPTGLQLQLGGYGGINYTLHTSNSAAKSIELGNAEAGLTPPKLLQVHARAPAFAKIEIAGYYL